MSRISSQQRIEIQGNAEREINRFVDDHYLWHKHVHDVELDAMQILKMIDMDLHHNTVDFSCRRTGKTACKEMYLLKFLACNPDQELGVVAPREAQAITNITYHTDAIRRSDILTAYLEYKNGRPQIYDGGYQFANRSRASAYGIMAQVDGGDLTVASLEEVDDMPADRLNSRFLLMLASTRRLGASKNSKNDPQIRVTGVFKGADTLASLVASGVYHVLPPVDCYLGIELGLLNEEFILNMRNELPNEEFIRQLLCRNVSAKNLIWEKYLRFAMQVGLKANLSPADPLPGETYKRRGLISFGYDCGGHGEDPAASKHALVVTEQIGNFVCFVFAQTWSAGADDMDVRRDLVSLWRYFKPDHAIGDAYGIGIISGVNDDLFFNGLSTVDRRAIGGGESTAATWPEWAFSPMRFEGMTKHQMAQAVRAIFHRQRAAIPYVLAEDGGCAPELILMQRQMANIKPEPVKKGSYSSYKMANRKIGDDLFDAAMAAVWAMATQGLANVPTVTLVRKQGREALLGGATSLLELH